MSGTDLRVAAANGETNKVLFLLDGIFQGSQSSLRLRRLSQEIRRVLQIQQRRHQADPAATQHVALEDFAAAYAEEIGKQLKPLEYGCRSLVELLESIGDTCTVITAFKDGGPTQVALAPPRNQAAYNIRGGIPENCIKVPVDSADDRGRTALWFAAAEGQAELVKILLDRSANVDVKDHKTGNTALIIACARGHEAASTALLKRGALVTATNNKGNTALCVAKTKPIARALIAAGADTTLLNYVTQPSGVFESAEAKAERLKPRAGGPPRGFANAVSRRSHGLPQLALAGGVKTGPPGHSRGVHFGSDRAETMIWNSDRLVAHGRSAAEVQWALCNQETARFLSHHTSPESSAKHAERCLAEGDSVAAAEAATVGLEAIAARTKHHTVHGADPATLRATHESEPVKLQLQKLLERAQDGDLQRALGRVKTKQLCGLSATELTRVLEPWLPPSPPQELSTSTPLMIDEQRLQDAQNEGRNPTTALILGYHTRERSRRIDAAAAVARDQASNPVAAEVGKSEQQQLRVGSAASGSGRSSGRRSASSLGVRLRPNAAVHEHPRTVLHGAPAWS